MRPLLIRLLAAVLLLQSAAAVSHGLRGLQHGGLLVVLCTMGETRSILLDAEGKEIPPPEGTGAFCPVCHALAATADPAPQGMAAPVRYASRIAWLADAAGWAHPPARAPPYPSRAPPQQA